MKVLSDKTTTDVGQTAYHNAAAAQGGKTAVTLKFLDASGHWWWVTWTAGAWSGLSGWVPFQLLSSS